MMKQDLTILDGMLWQLDILPVGPLPFTIWLSYRCSGATKVKSAQHLIILRVFVVLRSGSPRHSAKVLSAQNMCKLFLGVGGILPDPNSHAKQPLPLLKIQCLATSVSNEESCNLHQESKNTKKRCFSGARLKHLWGLVAEIASWQRLLERLVTSNAWAWMLDSPIVWRFSGA